MNRASKIVFALLTMTALMAMTGLPALAEGDESGEGWTHGAEFSYVLTSGNSKTSTLGLASKSVRAWERSAFEINAQAVMSDSTSYFPVPFDDDSDGTFDRFTRQGTSSTTAERYLLNARYDRKITDTFFWYGSLGWDRNEPSGIRNRYTAVAGVGNIWRDDDTVKFRTDYALTYTDQEDVIVNPLVKDNFVGARLSYGYLHQLAESTTFASELILDENLDDTDDWRADFYNSVAVAMSRRMALKVGLRVLYDNLPSIEQFDFPAAGIGGVPVTLIGELDETDTIFTTSLVITF